MPKLTGAQTVQLADELSQAFDRNEFNALVFAVFNRAVARIAAPAPHQFEVQSVLRWTEARGITVRLLANAMELRPDNQELQAIATPIKQLLISEVISAFDPTPARGAFQVNLQRIMRPELPFADVARWREKMENAERKVCRVELTQATGKGTGFLVARDLVLTCHHVVDELTTPDQISDVVLRFDHKLNPDKTAIASREYRLSPNWLAASGKSLDSSGKPLDYALLRVEGFPGDEIIGPAERTRGWLQLSSSKPAAGHPVQILQHPNTLPMKLALGIVLPDAPADLLFYNTNTDEGSSGSPVATGSWNVVALHTGAAPDLNCGICCRSILKDLEDQQLSYLLG